MLYCVRILDFSSRSLNTCVLKPKFDVFFPSYSQVQISAGSKSAATKFTTSGVDGRIVVWDVKV